MREVGHSESDAILGAMRQVALAGGHAITYADTMSVLAAGRYLLRRRDLADIGTLPAVEPPDLVSVLQRVVGIPGLREWMDAHGQAVLEREATVARHVVRVRVGLDDSHDPDRPPVGLLEVLLDRKRGIDDRGNSGRLVTDEIRGAAERVVDELRKDHDRRRYQPVPLSLLK